MSAGLSPDEVERTAKSAEDAARTPQSFFLAEPDPGSGIYFDSDHNGLAAALETASLELARDARTETILIRHTTHDGHASDGFYSMIVGGRPPDKKIEDRPPDGWLPLDTFVDARLRTFIADSFFNINGKRLKFTKRDWDTAVQALTLTRRNDAVETWLDSLPAWDGTNRLDTLFSDALLAEDTELNRAMARCLLIAGVRRTYEPGTKHDLLPILIGPQGGGKSTFCRELLFKPMPTESLSSAQLRLQEHPAMTQTQGALRNTLYRLRPRLLPRHGRGRIALRCPPHYQEHLTEYNRLAKRRQRQLRSRDPRDDSLGA